MELLFYDWFNRCHCLYLEKLNFIIQTETQRNREWEKERLKCDKEADLQINFHINDGI